MKDDDGTTEASAARKQPEKQIEESVESSKVSEIKNPAEQASISHSDLNKVLLGKALGPFYPRLIKWAEGLSLEEIGLGANSADLRDGVGAQCVGRPHGIERLLSARVLLPGRATFGSIPI